MAKRGPKPGFRHTPESRARISAALIGHNRKHSEETKAKIRATLRRQWKLIKKLQDANTHLNENAA